MSTPPPDLCSVTDKKTGTPPKTVNKNKMCCHGTQKHRCKLCGGSSICQHGRVKYNCKLCGGSSYCQHNKSKQYCKLCGGGSVCPHDHQKHKCKQCKGSAICVHGRDKYRCKPCGGSALCQHGRERTICRPCGGKSVCEHGKIKAICRDCKGCALCPQGCLNYGKQKNCCLSCGGSKLCKNCFLVTVSGKRKLCASCLPIPFRSSRNEETKLAAKIGKWAKDGKISHYTAWNKQNPLADPSQCGKYRVDFTFEMPSGVVLLECDEKQHSEYVRRCELVRQAEVALGFGGLPVHWIRYNPDAFKINGSSHVTKKEERESTLLRHLQLALTRPDYEHFITVTYICYDNPGTTNADPEALVQSHVFKTIEDYNTWAEKSS